MKLMIIGHARHGKDSVCAILDKEYGMTFESSSWILCKEFIFDRLKDKYGYKDEMECWEDRVNHRAEWYDLICEYNTPDKAALAKLIYKDYDIYCGLRSKEEFDEAERQGIFDFVIWVDASERLPPEDSSSMTVTVDDADYIVDNNGPETDLPFTLGVVIQEIKKHVD